MSHKATGYKKMFHVAYGMVRMSWRGGRVVECGGLENR